MYTSYNGMVKIDPCVKKYLIVSHDVSLRRVYIKGYRLHHGLIGAAGLLCGIALAGYGVSLVLDDWKDRPWIPRKELF